MKLTTEQAAKRVGVAQRTVRRWVAEGKLRAERTLGRHIRIESDELDRVRKAANSAEQADPT